MQRPPRSVPFWYPLNLYLVLLLKVSVRFDKARRVLRPSVYRAVRNATAIDLEGYHCVEALLIGFSQVTVLFNFIIVFVLVV